MWRTEVGKNAMGSRRDDGIVVVVVDDDIIIIDGCEG
jgi:hypothetical protein